ncbi:hypothetical protein IMG5_163400 [Ichthyophthirius multifiliis]|uniref:Protein kinase domain-containing protein n=1 Tax=Ichthyophthirius multifiliis TaxID=5932 RepID=G0R0C2_ICHMU|nr:hypothetical protein IMG5_163400 [Ichthyophthirius multifiliis]EGR29084.1 hypothetical protein IMG5_163400 [Ichthyophthirius multifiliis]|eukprot:XP_004030320.1 hypothetical protein IMG5_163400 [Ichthyophthirius multifiliis]
MTDRLKLLYNEIDIWKFLNHNNICKLYQIIDDPDDQQIHLIMQYCDLSQIMNWNEENLQYNPNTKMEQFIIQAYNIQINSKIIFKQISQGVKYLHDSNIVNRDIKIDNILCKSDCDLNEHFKLADFSTAKKIQNNEYLFDCAGTPGFRGPEHQFSVDKGYDGKKSDIWSLGISIYTYVNLKLPFWKNSEFETDLASLNDEIQFRNENSNEFKDLINKMCQKEQQNRINIDEVLQDKWFDF